LSAASDVLHDRQPGPATLWEQAETAEERSAVDAAYQHYLDIISNELGDRPAGPDEEQHDAT
jgi:hypothetical protein